MLKYAMMDKYRPDAVDVGQRMASNHWILCDLRTVWLQTMQKCVKAAWH